MQRLRSAHPQAARDDRSNARSNGCADQQPACESVSCTEHHHGQKQQALERLEPSESMALTLMLILLRINTLFEQLELASMRVNRQHAAPAVSQIVCVSRLRNAHCNSLQRKMTIRHPACDRISTHPCATKSRHSLLRVSNAATLVEQYAHGVRIDSRLRATTRRTEVHLHRAGCSSS
jgi:hypothetical protein